MRGGTGSRGVTCPSSSATDERHARFWHAGLISLVLPYLVTFLPYKAAVSNVAAKIEEGQIRVRRAYCLGIADCDAHTAPPF